MRTAIIIATHGQDEWQELAWSRAYPSAIQQGADGIIVWHEPRGTLAEARNNAARDASADWLCFLDADDELAPGYLAAMQEKYERDCVVGVQKLGEASVETIAIVQPLLAPAVRYVRPDGTVIPERLPNRNAPMDTLNHCVIGTLIPRSLFRQVGGFREWDAYEDWELFLRCVRAGAEIIDVPQAVYVAFTHPGRNSQDRSILERAYADIRREHQEWVAEHSRA